VDWGFRPGNRFEKLRPVQIWIVLNPAAGSGRALGRGRELKRLLPNAELKTTAGPGDGTNLAREATNRGIDLIVAVGGDGTLQEIVTGLCMDAQGTSRQAGPRLSLLPAGTGGDYRRGLPVSESPQAAATRLLCQETRAVDVGLVDFVRNDGRRGREAFINALTFGLGGLTTRLVEGSSKRLGGRLTYFLGSFRANLVQRSVPIQLEVDGEPLPLAPFTNVAVCLGRYVGGGMKIAPDAELDDGLFDIVTLETSKLGVLSLSVDIYQGSHVRRNGVHVLRGRTLVARPTRDEEVLVDLDGNQPGRLPIQVSLLPRAVELVL
jgi:YegS/Rv2252/BmrU family lipid kinase